MTLLADDEPPAHAVERPEGASDFLLVCDHASRRIPRSLGTLGLDETQLAAHVAWDIGAAQVARRMSALLDATLVLQNYSRLVIDCNRPPGAPSSIPTHSEYARITGNEGLSVEAANDRVAAVFTPYHAAIRDILDGRRDTGRRTLLVSVHSFTPVYLGEARRWHTGLMFRRDRRLGEALLGLLRRDSGLQVGDNEPYAISDSTDYTIPFHGESRQIAHVGIEIRQDLIADEPGQEAWAVRLSTLLPQAVI
jgi:predicted N-formylglutamate amidohydrolase